MTWLVKLAAAACSRLIATAWIAGVLAAPALSQVYDAEIYAVYFRSDSCPNCLILDPELESARTATADLAIRHLTVDIDAPSDEYYRALFSLMDSGLTDFYNAYLGLTGVVFLVDPATRLPVDCLTRREDAAGLSSRMRSALRRVREPETSVHGDIFESRCPRPLRRLPSGEMYGQD